ncbi:MAG: tyrosine-type recombinase/integrase [Acidimicrobiales bacterium]
MVCWSARRRCMFAGLAWTTSRTPPVWTATRWVRCSSPRDLASAAEHALVSLLAINGLRVSEAIGADIEALGIERGHRTLTVCRKGGKIVTIPLAPRTARAIDLAIGERAEGPIFLGGNGERLDRHAAWRVVRRLARRAGINKPVGPHTLRPAFITAVFGRGSAVAGCPV